MTHPHPSKCDTISLQIDEMRYMDVHFYVWSMRSVPHVICPFCRQWVCDDDRVFLKIRPATMEEYLDMRDMYGSIV